MIIVLSPAKTLNFEPLKAVKIKALAPTIPKFSDRAAQLIEITRTLSAPQLESLMSISPALAALNRDRFGQWHPEYPQAQSKPAILAFNGDVYDGLQAHAFTHADLRWANQHLRILSGLYGLLKPLDWLQAYRLEMGTKMANSAGRDLYQFWEKSLALEIRELVKQQTGPKKNQVLVNLASEEYFKAVPLKALDCKVITPVFKDTVVGASESSPGDEKAYKVISFFAKRARGLMARYVVDNRLKSPEALKAFTMDGYQFDASQSSSTSWIFKRRN